MARLVNHSFWSGRRVFLTGHTGFKGSWLALWLHRMGARVTGYALPPPTQPSLFADAGIQDHLTHVEADVRDADQLRDAVAEAQPSIVLHLAAQALVREGYAQPAATFDTNIMGTVHLLEAARLCPTVEAVVVVTSDKCYANRDWVYGYRETDRLGGADPYAASKACAELVARSYQRSFFHDADAPALATARAGNILGGGDWAVDRLVPDLMRGRLHETPVAIRSPRAVRPWQFVLDALAGYLMLAEHLVRDGAAAAEGWNFGPPRAAMQPVAHLVTAFQEAWPGPWTITHPSTPQPEETAMLRLDSTKAATRLGWRPLLSLEDTLQWTVDWYRAFAEAQDMHEFTREQLATYEQHLST